MISYLCWRLIPDQDFGRDVCIVWCYVRSMEEQWMDRLYPSNIQPPIVVEERCRRSNMKIRLLRSWNPGLGGWSTWSVVDSGDGKEGLSREICWKVSRSSKIMFEWSKNVLDHSFSPINHGWAEIEFGQATPFFGGAAFPFWLIVGVRGIFFLFADNLLDWKTCVEMVWVHSLPSSTNDLRLTEWKSKWPAKICHRLVIVQVLGPPVLGVGVPGHNLMTARCDPSSLALGEIFRRCQWPSKCMSLWCRPCRSRSKCHKCNMPLGERFTLQ